MTLYSPAEFELSSLIGGNGSQGFTATGTGNYSELTGPSQYRSVGDVNGDLIDDFILGAPGDIGTTSMTIGHVYLIFGMTDRFPPAELDLQTLNGKSGYVIDGITLGDRTGFAGGAADGHISLASLNGTDGFTINGIATDDNAGRPTGVGDINDDGFDDLVIGAYSAGISGEDYVVFGKKTSLVGNFPASFNLASLDGTNGFIVNGNAADDGLGIGVSSAGDVNNDGFDDVLIGATGVDYAGNLNAGTAYVIFGKATPFASIVEITSLDGSNGGALRGVAAGDNLGESVSWAGDVNKDGYDDILIGARYADPNSISSAGQSYLIYGGEIFAASFELGSLLAANGGDGSNGVAFNGFQESANAFRVSGIGDINKDGYSDLRIGSQYFDNALVAPGQAYIVFGKPTKPSVRVMPPSGLITNESGGTVSFSVSLTTQPTADVMIPISSSDMTEGTISINSLIFTTSNWNMPQTITVTGVNDNYSDGDIRYIILIGTAVSTDPAYNGLDPTDVSVTNIDNEVPPTKFYVVNDGNPDRTFEYGTTGIAVENYTLDSGNTAPRGIASNPNGDRVWVADANRKVYV